LRAVVLKSLLWKMCALAVLSWVFYLLLGYSVVYSCYIPLRVALVPKECLGLGDSFIHLDKSLSLVCSSEPDTAGKIVAGIQWLRSRPGVRSLFPVERWQAILADMSCVNVDKRLRG